MQNISFHIALDGEDYPVQFDETVLSEFEQKYVSLMDREVRRLSDASFGPTFYLTRNNQLGVIAPMLYQAINEGDGVQVAKCVLWLKSRFPEIAGMCIAKDTYEFVTNWNDGVERPKVFH